MITNCAPYLFFIGFLLQMRGSHLLYKFGFPPNVEPFGNAYLYSPPTTDELAKHNKYLKKNKRGFTLLLTGFIFQFPFTFISCFPKFSLC